MTHLLVSAYAVNPYKGSEDGTGWNWVCQMAKTQLVTVVTRKNNRTAIEKYLRENEVPLASNLTFLYYDLPYMLRFWKKGERGAMLYFYLWQLFLPLFVWKIRHRFHHVHHLNFHNNWTPTFLWILGKPLIWGPIGHHDKIPTVFLKKYGPKAWVKDRTTWLIKMLFWHFDPFLHIALAKTDTLLIVNSSEKKIHWRYKHKMIVIPAVAASEPTRSAISKMGFNVLSVGRFVPLKGFDVAIKAFALFYSSLPLANRGMAKLTLVGKGPEKQKLERLAKEEGIEHAIHWVEWVDKTEMQRIYQNADLFLFPSHEGAGMVIPEALSYGLPVICFANHGPGELTNESCSFQIPYGPYEKSIEAFAHCLSLLYRHPIIRAQMSQAAVLKWHEDLTWNSKGELLKQIYNKRTTKPHETREVANSSKQTISTFIETEF